MFGYDTGVINGALEPMKDDLGLTPYTEGLITATLLLGAAFGAMIGGRLNDSLGRKKTLTIVAIGFFVGTMGGVLAPDLPLVNAPRVILGLAVGVGLGDGPGLPGRSRPRPSAAGISLSGRGESAIVVGQMLAFIFNAIIANLWGHHDGRVAVHAGRRGGSRRRPVRRHAERCRTRHAG